VTAIALTIAGSDPSGGAGIQADLKTFHTHRVYGQAVLTLLTAQSTKGVKNVSMVAPSVVLEQLEVLFDDMPPHAMKTGALGTAAHVEVIASFAKRFSVPLVVDPVVLSKTRAVLLDAAGQRALLEQLFPLARLVTPNLDEAELLTGRALHTGEQIRAAARALSERGARAVLIKGGHREGEPIDVLLEDGVVHELRAARIDSPHTHGAGCSLSAAITAHIARGRSVLEACTLAKAWLTRAIASAPGLGHGQGPVNHFEVA
jgi:hydroxymethylpyrimidine/phosphomethylpyrimidine kinase